MSLGYIVPFLEVLEVLSEYTNLLVVFEKLVRNSSRNALWCSHWEHQERLLAKNRGI